MRTTGDEIEVKVIEAVGLLLTLDGSTEGGGVAVVSGLSTGILISERENRRRMDG